MSTGQHTEFWLFYLGMDGSTVKKVAIRLSSVQSSK